jgi:hypothetical protein
MNGNRPRGGYRYYVSDEQLAAFAKLTPLERLQWVDELRRFILLTETPETAARRERLRRGETIAPEPDDRQP